MENLHQHNLMNFPKIILSFFFLLLSNILFCQSDSDEIRLQNFIKNEEYDSISSIMNKKIMQPENILQLYDKYFLKSSNKKIKEIGKRCEVSALYNQKKYLVLEKKLISYLDSSEEPCHSIFLSKLFYTEKRLGNVQQGINYITKYGKNCDPETFYLHLATAKIYLKEYKPAIEYLYQYKKYFITIIQPKLKSEQEKSLELANIYNNLGDAYIKCGIQEKKANYLDSADVYYSKIYNLLKKNKVLKNNAEGIFLYNQGKLAFFRNDISLALYYFKKCKTFSRYSQGENIDLAFADCYYKLNKPETAIAYLNQYISYTKKLSQKENLVYAYHLLAQSYESANQEKMAYQYAKLCLEETENFNKNNESTSQVLHDFELKTIKNDAVKILDKKNSQQKWLLRFIVFIILITLCIIIYQLYKRRKIEKKLDDLIQKVNSDNQNAFSEQQTIQDFYTINNEKETEIIEKLLILEAKEFFLNKDFNLNTVAKKIGTNTTYLSQAINSYMKKTFREYSSELRINYILKELSKNKKLRNYTHKLLRK